MSDPRAIIEQTIMNMVRIYEDVGALMGVVEDKAKARGVQPVGYSDVTWDVSRALEQPKWWLYRWLGRAYWRADRPNAAVGFCVHLGDYEPKWIRPEFSLVFPFANVALIGLKKPAQQCDRKNVLNGIWGAGWQSEFSVESLLASRLVKGKYRDWDDVQTAVTAFVDLMALTSADIVERALVDPMIKLLDGDESWVSDADRALLDLDAKGLRIADDARS